MKENHEIYTDVQVGLGLCKIFVKEGMNFSKMAL